jgi:chromosome segregation ATPase
MTTVPILMSMLAVGVAVFTLLWCQKLAESAARARTPSLAEAEVRKRLGELENESRSLHAELDHLRQSWQADTCKQQVVTEYLRSRVTELLQGLQGLATVSQDLDGLREFRSTVEAVLRQWEDRGAELQQGLQGLAAVSQDLDGLKQSRSTVEAVLRQLEERVTELQQGLQGLPAVSQDLEGLQQSRSEVAAGLRQLEDRAAALEQGYHRLSAVSRDLDNLHEFRQHVERIHAGIQKAFNGHLSGTALAPRRDEETPSVDA